MGGDQAAVCEETSSPLKRLRGGTQEQHFMKRAGRDTIGDPLGPKQARVSEMKAGNQTRGHHMADKQPTAREIAAAKAARARLYGGEGGPRVRHLTNVPVLVAVSRSRHCAAPGLPFNSM